MLAKQINFLLDPAAAKTIFIPPLPRQRKDSGPLAQLGERLNGIQKVSGSIPLGSTKARPDMFGALCISGKVLRKKLHRSIIAA